MITKSLLGGGVSCQLTLGMKYLIGRPIDMSKTLTHTCLPATPEMRAAGFTVFVALEHDRVPLAAFKLGVDASAWCDEKNGIIKSVQKTTSTLAPTQTVGVGVTKPSAPAPAPASAAAPAPAPAPAHGPTSPKP